MPCTGSIPGVRDERGGGRAARSELRRVGCVIGCVGVDQETPEHGWAGMKTCTHGTVDGFFCERCYIDRGGSLDVAESVETVAPSPDGLIMAWVDAVVSERIEEVAGSMTRMEKRLRGLERWADEEGADQ